MTLLRWQQNIVDEEGNVLPSATVEIRDEVSGALVNLFEDIDGNTVKGNPLTVDSDGYGFAYMEPGRLKITATSADQSFTKSWRDVRLANDFSELDSRINQRVIYVGSVADLRLRAGFLDGEVIRLSGHQSAGDGGGGDLRVVGDATTEVDDDGTLFAIDGKVIQRIEESTPIPEWFGAADDASFSDAANLAKSLKLLPVTYSFASSVTLTDTGRVISGSGWHKDAAEALTGTVIEAVDGTVASLLTLQSSSPGSQATTEIEGVTVERAAFVHKGAGAGLAIDNVIRSNINDVYVDCDNAGQIGIRYDNWGFFSLLNRGVVQRFAGVGVLIAGTGTQHTIKDSHIAANNETATAAVEVRRPGAIIEGGQINIANAAEDGAGVLFFNPDGVTHEGGTVRGTLSESGVAVRINGSTNPFADVLIDAPRWTLGSGQTGVEFLRATDCLLRNPVVISPTGGTVAVFGANALRCGMVGNFDACRSPISVDPGAVDCYKICNSRISYAQRGSITTDPNITTICEDVGTVGRTVHNGRQWDKLFFTMPDDTSEPFEVPVSLGGRVKVIVRDRQNANAEYAYRLTSGIQAISPMYEGTQADSQVGFLNGTTGADGSFTTSVDSTNERMYIENRLGVTVQVMVVFEGTDW